MAVGIDADLLERVAFRARQRVKLHDCFQLVAKEGKAPGPVFQVGWPHLQTVTPHAEAAALECLIVAAVLLRHQFRHHLADIVLLADQQILRHRRIGFHRPDAVDAGHRGDDDHIVAFQQRPGRRMAQPVDLLVDLAFLLDIGVRPRHIGFGLIVVIVADKVFDGVFGKEPFEFAVELRSQRLVGRQDDRRALRGLNHLGHGKGLAGAGRPQQHLIALSRHHPFGKLDDGLWLIAGRFKLSLQHKALPAFQLGARQHLGAQGRGVCIVVGHGLIPSRRPNLTCSCSLTSPDARNTATKHRCCRPRRCGGPCIAPRFSAITRSVA